MTTSIAIADPAPPAVRQPRRPLSRLAVLFPPAPGRPLTRLDFVLGTLVVAAAVAVSLLRVTGTGALQSIWQEDGNEVLTLAYYRTPAKTLLDPINGYFTIVARALGLLAVALPVSWAAAVLSLSAAILLGLMVLVVYVASGAHLSSRLARVMVTVPLLIVPMAENVRTEVYARPVCLHLFALYVLFWVVLWVPGRRAAQIAAITVTLLAAGSTVVTIAFIPLALLRVLVRRDRTGVGILGALGLGGAANALIMMGGPARPVMYPDPLVALWDYVVWGMPGSVLGYRATSGLLEFHFPTVWQVDVGAVLAAHVWVILLSWAAVAAVVAVAVLRRPAVRPAWLLAFVAFAHSVALFCFMVMAQGNEPRYLVPVELLVFAGLTVLLLPAPGAGGTFLRTHAPLLALAAFIAVVSAFNFRWDDTYRSHAPLWTEQIRKAAVECKQRPELKDVLVRSAPEPWGSVVHIPCHRLTEVRPWDCLESQCSMINGLPARRDQVS